MEGKNHYLLSAFCISLGIYENLCSLSIFLFSKVMTQNMHLKSRATFHVGQETSITKMKWFYNDFALIGVLHRGFPGKMSRQPVSKAQNEGKIHLDAT